MLNQIRMEPNFMLSLKYKIFFKILIFACTLTFINVNANFCADLLLRSYYGINNVAKYGRLLPLEINIENRDNSVFNGQINVKVYESNESFIQYIYNIQIEKESTLVKNIDVSTSDEMNMISIEVYDMNNIKIAENTMNIDLSYLKNRIIIGILSDDVDSLQYFDNISLSNNGFVTKTVEISERDFYYNRKLLDQIDILIISDKNSNNISPGLNEAILSFYNDGNVVLISLGEYGDVGIPNCFLNLSMGPVVVENINLSFNPYIESEEKKYNLPISIYNFYNNSLIYAYDNYNLIQKHLDGNSMLINTAFSLNDINDFSFKSIFAKDFLENTIGVTRLNQLNVSNNSFSNINYYNIESLLNLLDNKNFPDIIKVTFLIILYFLILSVILFTYLKNKKKLKFYGRYVVVFSFIFLFLIFILDINSIRQRLYMTYVSFVEIDELKNRESVYLNFKTSNKNHFSFLTSQNIDIYPLIKDKNEPVILNDNKTQKYKITNIENVNKNIKVSVINSNDFENNIFAYINKSHLNNVYNIDVDLKYFDGVIDGRITNNMNQKIKNATIFMFGKTIKIGEIEPNYSKSLKNARAFNSPINNSIMTSDMATEYPENNFVKYFLDNNANQYFENGYFLGFIDDNKTLNINLNDSDDIHGETLIIKKINIDFFDQPNTLIDITPLKNNIENKLGNYSIITNTTNGENDVVNIYTFDYENEIQKIYFDNLSSFDSGKMNYFVPFYGNISFYNINTKNYDMILKDSLDANELKYYIDKNNKLNVRYSPLTHDLFYRDISLPIIRAIVKND